MADQLSVLQSVKNAQNEILAVLDQQKQVMTSQLALSQALRESAAGGTGVEGLSDKVFEINSALKAAGDSGKTAMESLEEHSDKAKKKLGGAESAATGLKGRLQEIGKGAEAFMAMTWTETIKAGFGLAIKLGASLLSFFVQVAKSAFNIGYAIYSIPTTILSNLIKLSNEQAQAFKHITEAFEAFRGKFGDLNNEIGTSMKSALLGAQDMGQYGIGFYSIFTDAADAIGFFSEMFGAMGPLVDTFAGEIADMGEKFTIVTKSLGLTGEHMKGLALNAKASGRSLEETLDGIAAQATIMHEEFGVSSKLIGQDMAQMAGDVGHFGNMSDEALGAAAMRIRSLGLEVGVLGKLVDKFLNFEDAAKNASMLSQSFGVNLDALQLMNGAAEGGADTLDQLRNAMFAAGKDASKMSTAELRLLAQTSGLSEEEAKLAFSMENRGKNMEDIRKAAKKSDPQERMADTMERLAGNIERIIRVFSYDSFFGAFLMGFDKGVKLSEPFVEMLANLHNALDLVHEAGMAVGEAFVNTFPGVMDMITAFNDMFNPTEYGNIADSLKTAFKEMFNGLADPLANHEEIMENFWSTFMSAVDPKGADSISAWDKFRDAFWSGFIKFLGGMSGMIAGLIPVVQKKLTAGITKLVSMLSNMFLTTADEAFTGPVPPSTAENIIESLWKPIWTALKAAWNNPEFRDAIWSLGVVILKMLWKTIMWLGNKIKEIFIWFRETIKENWKEISAAFLATFAVVKILKIVLPLLATVATTLGSAISAIFTGLGAMMSAFFSLGAVVGAVLMPFIIIGAFVAAIALIAAAIGGNWMLKMFEDSEEGDGSLGDYFGQQFKGMSKAFTDVFKDFGGIMSDMWEGKDFDDKKLKRIMKNIGTIVKNGLVLATYAVVNGIAIVLNIFLTWFFEAGVKFNNWLGGILDSIWVAVGGGEDAMQRLSDTLDDSIVWLAKTGTAFGEFASLFTMDQFELWGLAFRDMFSNLFIDLQRDLLGFAKSLMSVMPERAQLAMGFDVGKMEADLKAQEERIASSAAQRVAALELKKAKAADAASKKRVDAAIAEDAAQAKLDKAANLKKFEESELAGGFSFTGPKVEDAGPEIPPNASSFMDMFKSAAFGADTAAINIDELGLAQWETEELLTKALQDAKNKTTNSTPSKPVQAALEALMTSQIDQALGEKIDLEAAIKAHPNALNKGAKDQKLVIEHKSLSLTLNLTITMDAAEVAKAVCDTGQVMPAG